MKRTILIIEGIIAAIAILAVVIVCLLPAPERGSETTAGPIPKSDTAPVTDASSETEGTVTDPVFDTTPPPSATVPPERSTVPPTDPTAPPTEPTAPPTEPPTATQPSETPFTPADSLENADYGRIVFVGDSRTRTMASGGAYEFRLVPDDSVSATWGGTLYDGRALQDVTEAVFKRRPVMVFWYGINDVQMHPERDNTEIFIKNYDALLSLTVNNPGCRVYVLSILTTTVRERDYYEGQNENIRRYNEALERYCEAHGYVYVDITSLLTGDECFYPGDNIHFSESWYRERFLPTVLRKTGLLK